MKNRNFLLVLGAFSGLIFYVSCSSGPKETNSSDSSKAVSMVETWSMKEYITGELPPIDPEKVTLGATEFGKTCIACHKMDQKVIGPALKGVTSKRSANWLMNILLHNEEMVKNDPDAKALFEANNKTAMTTVGIDETKARAILDYLRSEDAK
jgi:mono/diheme cytochrome c family protein